MAEQNTNLVIDGIVLTHDEAITIIKFLYEYSGVSGAAKGIESKPQSKLFRELIISAETANNFLKRRGLRHSFREFDEKRDSTYNQLSTKITYFDAKMVSDTLKTQISQLEAVGQNISSILTENIIRWFERFCPGILIQLLSGTIQLQIPGRKVSFGDNSDRKDALGLLTKIRRSLTDNYRELRAGVEV